MLNFFLCNLLCSLCGLARRTNASVCCYLVENLLGSVSVLIANELYVY